MTDVSTQQWNLDAVIPGQNRHRPPNRFYFGDNLLLMQELLPELEGKIDLIYADPPFDAGVDFKMTVHFAPEGDEPGWAYDVIAYPDRWNKKSDEYMQMMRPRLELMYQLLSERGALWLHCDVRTNHRLRVVLDELFGQRCVNEIVWAYGAGGNPSSAFPRKHDYLLVYSKSGRIEMNKDAPIMRVPYNQSTLTTHYRLTDADGRRYRAQVKNGREYRTYADEGKLVTDVWTDIGGQLATSPISREYTGYVSQKPEKLLERIIAGTTQPDWLVADFFAGSGTTGVVASKLGRRWLMADYGLAANLMTIKRMLEVNERTADAPSIEMFKQIAPAETHQTRTEFSLAREANDIVISLLDFIPDHRSPYKTQPLFKNLRKIEDGRGLVDSWAISWHHNEDAPFAFDRIAVRSRKDDLPPFQLRLPRHELNLPTIRARVYDIFGNESNHEISLL